MRLPPNRVGIMCSGCPSTMFDHPSIRLVRPDRYC